MKEELKGNQQIMKEIEEIISKAIKKIGGKKENELCKYLPMKSGGYMHHFTMKKMKHRQPEELISIIERYVIQAEKPLIVPPKQRASRGSRKRKDHLNLTRNQLERMISIARLAGDKEILTILSPRKSITAAKKDLIQSVRQGRVEQELWNSYVEAMSAQNLSSAESLMTQNV